jgi:hypothetical protein
VISSVSISEDGRRFQAAGPSGVYFFEKARGPLDIDARPGSGIRVLATDDTRLSLSTLDASGSWVSSPSTQRTAELDGGRGGRSGSRSGARCSGSKATVTPRSRESGRPVGKRRPLSSRAG